VLINAAFAVWASGLTEDFKSALEKAEESVDTGKAKEKLDGLVALSQQKILV